MSPLHFVIMLIIAIIILTVLTLKFKMHPVMVLFLTATFCGLASGKTLVDTFAAITKYFGSTLGSIGVMIILVQSLHRASMTPALPPAWSTSSSRSSRASALNWHRP